MTILALHLQFTTLALLLQRIRSRRTNVESQPSTATYSSLETLPSSEMVILVQKFQLMVLLEQFWDLQVHYTLMEATTSQAMLIWHGLNLVVVEPSLQSTTRH